MTVKNNIEIKYLIHCDGSGDSYCETRREAIKYAANDCPYKKTHKIWKIIKILIE